MSSTAILSIFAAAVPVFALPTSASGDIYARTHVCLAIISIVIFVLSVLVIFKYLYVKHRRAMYNRSRPSSTLTGSFNVDSNSQSSVSYLQSVAGRNSESEKAGYLVGFFGCPAWESGIKTDICKATREGYKQFMYQLDVDSRRRSGQVQSLNLQNARSGPIPLALADFNHGLRSMQGAERPVQSTKAQIACSVMDFNRRFSLPSVSQNGMQDVFQQKRHSSFESAGASTRAIVSGTAYLPGGTSLRLVEAKNPEPDVWTPTLQSTLPPPPFPGHLSFKSRPKPVPPTPCLPMPPNAHVPTASRISHPYALGQHPKIDTVRSPTAHSPNLFLQQERRILKPLLAYPPPSHTEHTPHPRRPSVTHSTDASPFGAVASSNISPPLTFFPYPPFHPNNPLQKASKAKYKRKLPSARATRSPAIGPSPLRTMILPETPTEATDIYLTSPDPNNKENADTNQWNMDGKCSNFGLGLRRSGPEKPQTSEQDDPGRGCSTPTGDPRPGNKYINEQADGASNMLLGIIRELVDETRQWDASLFMNENFKSMLFKYDDSNLGGPKFTNSTEPENDNGLVGVNEGPVTKQLDMISFWEEGDWRHANDHPENVGLAC